MAKPSTKRAPRKKKPAAAPDRRTWLGGSDFAAVLGVSPWQTPVQLWKEKTGRAEPRKVDPARERRFARGKKLEPFVLDMVLDKLQEQGLQVELLARNARYADPEHAFLSVEIDFELRLTGTLQINGQDVTFAGEHINGDCKTVHGFARKKWGEEETEDVPIEYAAQFMGGLMVTGRRYCLVAALIGLDDVMILWTVRDEETIAAMRPKLVSFWLDHVRDGMPPDPIKFNDIKELFPLDNGRTVEATPAVAKKVEDHRAISQNIKLLELQLETLKLDIAEYLGDFMRLTVGGREAFTFKPRTFRTLNEKALRRDHPDWYALYENETETRVLLASRRGR